MRGIALVNGSHTRRDRPLTETTPWVLTVREAEYIAARFGPVEIAGDGHPAWAG